MASLDLLSVLGGFAPATPRFVGWPPVAMRESTAHTTANRGEFYEVPELIKPLTVTQVWFSVAVSAGNICIALYRADTGARLGTTGSFACPSPGMVSQPLAASVVVPAGVRLVAGVVSSGTTTAFHGFTSFAQALFRPGVEGPFLGGFAAAMMPLPDPLPTLAAGFPANRLHAVFFTP